MPNQLRNWHGIRPKEDSVKQDDILLQLAIVRLVQFGQQVGVSPEEMVLMLESGVSVHDLLAFLERKASGA